MNKKRDITGITSPKGFYAASGTCGMKPSGMPDLALIAAETDCAAAGVFTRNKVPGEPVKVSKKHLRTGFARAIICNSGVSNVCTGDTGRRNALMMCRLVANAIDVRPESVLVCSTGVIGVPLPMDKIKPGIAAICGRLTRGGSIDKQVATAILTTDLVPKTASRQFTLGGKTITLAGVAKGSGMIAPNMATMLCFITTDAAIKSACLSYALKQAVNQSFNRISVDEDTSTSDSVLVLASGKAGNRAISQTSGRNYHVFFRALTDLCCDLATRIVRDGEGATKLIRVVVTGARSERDADRVGKTVVGSPLVKTAVHGGDPNWGRIVMAVGRSGAAVNPSRLSVSIGGSAVFRNGCPVEQTKASLRKLQQCMNSKEVEIVINLKLGSVRSQWLGCDLSRQYIDINADYTT